MPWPNAEDAVLVAEEPVPNAVELDPLATVLVGELAPTAIAPPADAVGLWPATQAPKEPEPIAIDVELLEFPPPALYPEVEHCA
ncbi:hypothetical protein BLA39750_07796 [Burkholderia lata]|uniref:Uncharacterized protein n=1 Tax=Burkholderia lata (strain ATCC 17760 / DSM 23089 / LMG 22485 / NCIMB 9086 / R18194 / 383) TaxID=482957 RepID=A0A6P3C8I0_BURL3|nr:hypothetical protein BLA39750_07796 [Burkholderia lata]